MKRAKQILALLTILAMLFALGGVAEAPEQEGNAAVAGAEEAPLPTEEKVEPEAEAPVEQPVAPEPEALEEAELEALPSEAEEPGAQAAPEVSRSASADLLAAEDDEEEEEQVVFYTSKLTMSVGESQKPKASSLADKAFTYFSSNRKVAVVNDKGKITAKAVGTATITVKGKTSHRSATCKVTVRTAPIAVKLNKTSVKRNLDGSVQLKATIEPSSAIQKVKWKSSNEEVASVEEDGLVTAVGEGSATIYATATKRSEDGKRVRASCKIRVVDPEKPATFMFEKEGPLKVFLDDTLTLETVMTPDTAESEIKWKSSNGKIATVEDGEVTGVREGTVTITATTVSKGQGGKRLYDTMKVMVIDPAKPAEMEITAEGKRPLVLSMEDTLTLDYKLTPKTAESDVKWKSLNPKIATVEDGEVTPVKAGTVYIQATTVKKGKGGKKLKDRIKVIVVDPSIPISVKLDASGTVTLHKDDELELSATILPETAEDAELKWSSSDPKIASVEDGVVTPHRKGTVTITVKTKPGGKKDSVKVRVVP